MKEEAVLLPDGLFVYLWSLRDKPLKNDLCGCGIYAPVTRRSPRGRARDVVLVSLSLASLSTICDHQR
ncbi:MAG TPA: hypothetical protein VGK24_11600 [Candidatus Angelobacter sp.]